MVDRRVSLKMLFIFTALVAIVLAGVVQFPILRVPILLGIVGAYVGFRIAGHIGLVIGLHVGFIVGFLMMFEPAVRRW